MTRGGGDGALGRWSRNNGRGEDQGSVVWADGLEESSQAWRGSESHGRGGLGGCLEVVFVIDGLGSDPVPCVGAAIPNRGLLIAGFVAAR